MHPRIDRIDSELLGNITNEPIKPLMLYKKICLEVLKKFHPICR